MLDEVKLRVRAHDPVSSVLAAECSMEFSNTHKGRIQTALKKLGTATAHEIGEACGLSVVQTDRRLPELLRDGAAEVLQLAGEDVMRDGFRVWRLVEKNLAASATNS